MRPIIALPALLLTRHVSATFFPFQPHGLEPAYHAPYVGSYGGFPLSEDCDEEGTPIIHKRPVVVVKPVFPVQGDEDCDEGCETRVVVHKPKTTVHTPAPAAPTTKKAVPVVHTPVPTREKAVPVVYTPVPTTKKAVPVVHPPVPTTKKVVSVIHTPVPTTKKALVVTPSSKATMATVVKAPGTTDSAHATEPCDEETTVHAPAPTATSFKDIPSTTSMATISPITAGPVPTSAPTTAAPCEGGKEDCPITVPSSILPALTVPASIIVKDVPSTTAQASVTPVTAARARTSTSVSVAPCDASEEDCPIAPTSTIAKEISSTSSALMLTAPPFVQAPAPTTTAHSTEASCDEATPVHTPAAPTSAIAKDVPSSSTQATFSPVILASGPSTTVAPTTGAPCVAGALGCPASVPASTARSSLSLAPGESASIGSSSALNVSPKSASTSKGSTPASASGSGSSPSSSVSSPSVAGAVVGTPASSRPSSGTSSIPTSAGSSITTSGVASSPVASSSSIAVGSVIVLRSESTTPFAEISADVPSTSSPSSTSSSPSVPPPSCAIGTPAMKGITPLSPSETTFVPTSTGPSSTIVVASFVVPSAVPSTSSFVEVTLPSNPTAASITSISRFPSESPSESPSDSPIMTDDDSEISPEDEETPRIISLAGVTPTLDLTPSPKTTLSSGTSALRTGGIAMFFALGLFLL